MCGAAAHGLIQAILREVVLTGLERELAVREWQDLLAGRPETDLGGSASALLAAARSVHDGERR